jgi:hypothetical protein
VTAVKYRRIQHAGHYGYAGADSRDRLGHDLEEWVYAKKSRLPVPNHVPGDAHYHSGFMRDGTQHWVYTRIAPMTGTCPICAQASRERTDVTIEVTK